LNDVSMSAEQALEDHAIMMRYVTRMLVAGMVHGDLSEFNVLVDDYGPVIIDLPQVVDSTANNNARKFLLRDVNKITEYYGHYAPELLNSQYGEEIWALYEAGDLHPESELTGAFQESTEIADVDSVLMEIKAAMQEEMERQERMKEA
jgi:RIO kinase 1